MSKGLRLVVASALLGAFVLAGWSQTVFGAPAKHTSKAALSGTVYFLNPEQFTGRWVKDAAYFKAKLHRLAPGLVVQVSNANANASLQLSQGNAAIAAGAKAIVIGAVDQNLAAPIVNKAAKNGIPVIAYDRFIKSPALKYYDSFDGVAVGKLQGRWLASHAKRGATIVVINGSLTDDNAHLFNKGYMSILTPKFKSGYFKNGGTYWTDQWVPATAGREMDNALTKNHNNVGGVLSANDGMAAAIVASLKRVGKAGIPVTGQDAQPDALGRILDGTQGMTVYKPLYLEANSAALAVNAILRGHQPPGYNRMYRGVHAALFKPIKIVKSNVARVVKDGFATWAQVCTGIPASKCKH